MRVPVIFVLALLLVTPVLAEQVVINSNDWRDVFSGVHYATLTDREALFVIDTEQGADIAERVGTDPEIILITGREQAMPGFKTLIQSRGYTINEEITSNNVYVTNQELATRSGATNVILVDDAYGYNAISVATYAKQSNSFVLFVEPGISETIQSMGAERVLLYGHIPPTVFEEVEILATTTVNNQDRFEDNFAIVKKFVEEVPQESIILSNGEFIELGVIVGEAPLLFIGRETVPDEVIDFLNDNHFRMAVLVGNALAPNAKYIKDNTGMSIFIKFAQGRNQEQYALDLFPVPVSRPVIGIESVQYDPVQRLLIVTYQNTGSVATYVTGSFQGPDGSVDDRQPVFVDAGTYKTVQYSLGEPDDEIAYSLLFGSSPVSLEFIMQGVASVNKETIDDSSELFIVGATYHTGKETLLVTIENTGPVPLYALVEVVDVRVGADVVRLSAAPDRVGVGEERVFSLPVVLSERDVERNSEVNVQVFFGEREFSLINAESKTLPFSVTSGGVPMWVWVMGGFVLLVLFFLLRKKKR